MPNSGQELSTLVQEEFENDEAVQAKLDDSTITEREREAINHANSEQKKLIISEEKLTRLLFVNILKWFQAERAKVEEAEAKSKASEEKISSLTSDGLRQFAGKYEVWLHLSVYLSIYLSYLYVIIVFVH
jgi:hypothetical protein